MPIDPYTSRLETNMRLLSDRLAWLDAQARGLAAENEGLRRELDFSMTRIEAEARDRANRIVASAEARAATLDAAGTEEIERRRAAMAGQVDAVEREARIRIEELRARAEVLAEGPTPVQVVMVQPEPEADLVAELETEIEGAPAATEPEPMAEPLPLNVLPAPDGEPVPAEIAGPAPIDKAELEARRDRADALQQEIDALLDLRETIVVSIRETLIGMAEELARSEREHADAGPASPLGTEG